MLSTADALAEAKEVATIKELQFIGTGSIVIEEDLVIPFLHIFNTTTVSSGATITARDIMIWGSDDSTVSLVEDGGTVAGVDENSRIYLHGDGTLTLGGTTYEKPEPAYFGSWISRVFAYEEGVGWKPHKLIDVDVPSRAIGADISSFDEIARLTTKYPELEYVSLYGDDPMDIPRFVGFNENRTLGIAGLEYALHGNQTIGGNPFDALTIAANVTLTIASGVSVEFISDPGKTAIEGADNTSKIVIEDGADVAIHEYIIGSEEPPEVWAPGTYIWDTTISDWVDESAPAPAPEQTSDPTPAPDPDTTSDPVQNSDPIEP
jgi:hypothetical protein